MDSDNSTIESPIDKHYRSRYHNGSRTSANSSYSSSPEQHTGEVETELTTENPEHDIEVELVTTRDLSLVNYLNVVFYLINTIATFGVGVLGWFRNANFEEVSEKYQTLITPDPIAFNIWLAIFGLQGLFVLVQLCPQFGATEVVQNGVWYWYILCSILQVGWVFAFSDEALWASLVCIVFLWICLMMIVYSQYTSTSDGTMIEFWILRFPFNLHCGWITCAVALNVNAVILKEYEPDANYQLAVGIVSIASLHAVAVWVLFGIDHPNYTIAGVIAWSFGWIFAELSSSTNIIVLEERFTIDIIEGVSYASVAIAFITAGQIFTRLLLCGK